MTRSSKLSEWDALDAQQWRHDGPYDIDEVDLDDGVKRLDLGSLIITPFAGAQLRLQMDEKTQQVVSVLIMGADAGLELTLHAAPKSGGLWPDLRDEAMRAAKAGGGKAELSAGPFGTELRRLMPATTPDGKKGVQPSRTIAAEGPRWLLRGTLLGAAAMVEGDTGAVEPFLNLFRDTVVRRGEEPMAPGEIIGMKLPASMNPQG